MAYIGRDIEYGVLEKQTLTADSSTTDFTLDYGVGSSTSLIVSVGGVIQEPDVAYTASGHTISFAAAPQTGDTVFLVYMGEELITSMFKALDWVDYEVHTGDNSTTQFSLKYTPARLQDLAVSINGIEQRPTTDFTLSGNTLTMTTAPQSGVKVLVYYLQIDIGEGGIADGTVTNPKIVSMDAAKLVGSLPSGMSIDLTPEYQDISTLGLQWANVENKVAFNLTDDFMDVFQDDSGWVAYNGAVTTTPSSASDFTGSTSSFSYGSGSLTATTNNTAIYSTATLSGDFEVEATITGGESAAGWFGVFDSAEVGTFSSSQENGNMGSFTDTWFIATQSRDSKTEGLCGGSNSSLAAYTCNNNDVHKFKRVGSTLTVYQNGNLKYTETNIITGTMHVLFGAGGGGSSPFSSYESISWIADQQTPNTGSENVNRDTVGEYMSSIYTDTSVITPSSSSDWAAPAGDPAGSIAGNTFSSGRLFYSNGGDEALRSATTVSGDFEFQVTVTEGQTAGAWVSVFDASEIGTFTHHETGNVHSMNNSYYYAAISRAGQTAGFTARTSGSATNTAYSSANGDVVKITREGSTIKNYLNGTLKATATGVPTGEMYICLGGGGGSASVESDYTSISWQTSSQYTNTSGKVVSTTSTADSTVSEATGVIVYKDGTGTNTIGTDLKAYFSADDGSNWTEAASYGNPITFAGDSKVIPLGKTTMSNTGTQVKMKAEWANQAVTIGTAKAITSVGDATPSSSLVKIGNSSIYSTDTDGAGLTVDASDASWDSGTNNFTWEAWIRTVDKTKTQEIISFYGSGGGELGENTLMRIHGSSIKAKIGGQELVATETINNNTWHHICFERTSATQFYLYVDGVGTASSGFSSHSIATNSVTIANHKVDGGDNTENFDGYIDEVRISNVARYNGTNFTPSTTAFTSDSDTQLLIHSNESSESTTFTDSSSNAHTITVAGNIKHQPPVKKFGTSSIYFPANSGTTNTQSWLEIEDTPIWDYGTNDFTWEMWVRVPTISRQTKIFGSEGWSDSGAYDWIFDINPNRTLRVQLFNGSSAPEFSTSTALAVDTWTHVAVSRSSGTMKIFMDGVESASSTRTESLANLGTPYIGWKPENALDGFVGYMDEIRLSDVARYTSGFTPSTTAFTTDNNTQLLIHGDNGITDSSPIVGKIAELHGWSVNY